ncbi:MAG: chemotaxis protein CheW [Nitrospinae bacterium]|nr:chemotaxis protein CheW [Nitrospinota bacterium]
MSNDKALDRMLVRIEHLDTLLNLVGEVIITSNNLHTTNRRIQAFYDQSRPLDKLCLDMLKSSEVSSNRISSDLHSLVMDIRMVEIRQTFQRFRRSIRDLAKGGGKQVEFVTEGEETLVDKTIAEKLYDPLNHQIRNAVDHGVEDPLERQRAGKNPVATVTLKAYQKENDIFIEIQDDGRGIDLAAVAAQAVKRGLVEESALASLKPPQIHAFIYHPGLSTKAQASQMSGRGVGMDVVKSNVEELGGEITIESTPGKGSRFTYRIPQVTAVNIVDCLTVRAGKNHYAIPILNVISTLSYPLAKISSAFGKARSIVYLGGIVTLFDLNELLKDEPIEEQDEITVVIVESKYGRIAVRVSELLSPEKLVFTPLSTVFNTHGISGTTMIAGNRMGLIVDPQELVLLSRGKRKRVEEHDAEVQKSRRDAGDEGEADAWRPAAVAAPRPEEPEAGLSPGGGDAPLQIGHREEFLMELEEMLKEADEQVLSLENNASDKELVNRIFRIFHSMKGNLMMVGLTELGGVIHEVESIMDRVRGGGMEITADIIDILLDTTDTVKEAKKAIASGQTPAIKPSLREALEKYRKPKEVKGDAPVDVNQRTFSLGSLEQFNLMAQRYSGQSVYQAYLSFKPQYQQPFLVALLILKRITRIGSVYGSVPMVEEIEAQNIGTQIKILFSSHLPEEAVNAFFADLLVPFYDVTDYQLLKES